jgi:molybdopterin synthase sulfur carrier subunit
MQLKIKYFGLLAEVTNCQEEYVNSSLSTVKDLLDMLHKKYPELKDKDFQIAQNNTIVALENKLKNTEIALLPPFSGG